MRTKDEVRDEIWRAMDREGVSRFPGAEGRIPNFAGAKQAAERLARNPDWMRATTIKANPDSPQTHARRLALDILKQIRTAESLSAAVGYLAIKYFIRYLGSHSLDAFAWYRLALAGATMVWLIV